MRRFGFLDRDYLDFGLGFVAKPNILWQARHSARLSGSAAVVRFVPAPLSRKKLRVRGPMLYCIILYYITVFLHTAGRQRGPLPL